MGGNRCYCIPEHGFINTWTVANPAVATNLAWPIPVHPAGGPNIVLVIESVCFTFTTVGANRQVNLILRTAGGLTFSEFVPGLVQPAGTDTYTAGIGLRSMRLGNFQSLPLPRVILETSDVLATDILFLAGADQIAGVVVRGTYWSSN